MNTSNLELPEIIASQAQKEVTHNEALWKLDAICQGRVLDRDRTEPPLNPVQGDVYIPAAGATGDWSGLDGKLVQYLNETWIAYVPKEGWRVWVVDEDRFVVYNGPQWVEDGMSSADMQALQNIENAEISAAQWGYVGDMDQSVASGDSPTFYTATLTGGSTARLNITGDTQASIKFRDNSGGLNEKIIAFLNEGGVSKWRVENDAGGLNHDNVLVMDHSNGCVGVGVTSPASNLHVKGSSGLFVEGTGISSISTIQRGTGIYQVSREVLQLDLKTITESDVVDGFGPGINFSYTDKNVSVSQLGSIGFIRDGGENAGSFYIKTNVSFNMVEEPKFMVHADGNVGIGTSAPKAKLHVVGLEEHADNAAAIAAGLTIGAFYRTGDLLKVVH
ncbi:DUF2793 domain-containing protein [Magnetococcales bacterium HHB-1]